MDGESEPWIIALSQFRSPRLAKLNLKWSFSIYNLAIVMTDRLLDLKLHQHHRAESCVEGQWQHGVRERSLGLDSGSDLSRTAHFIPG